MTMVHAKMEPRGYGEIATAVAEWVERADRIIEAWQSDYAASWPGGYSEALEEAEWLKVRLGGLLDVLQEVRDEIYDAAQVDAYEDLEARDLVVMDRVLGLLGRMREREREIRWLPMFLRQAIAARDAEEGKALAGLIAQLGRRLQA